MSSEYGTVVLRIVRHDDGTRSCEIEQADPVIGIASDILAQLDPEVTTVTDAGHLLVCGAVAYRPVRFDRSGVVVCEQITLEQAVAAAQQAVDQAEGASEHDLRADVRAILERRIADDTTDDLTDAVMGPVQEAIDAALNKHRERAEQAETAIERVRVLAEAARESAAAESEPHDPLQPLISARRILDALNPPRNGQ